MASSRAGVAEMPPHAVSDTQQADVDESVYEPKVKQAKTTSDTPTLLVPDHPGLETIFNNPIIISSFINNFDRKDYKILAQVAATIPGVTMPWPIWDPMTEPWPRGVLPFDIRDLPIQCGKKSRLPSRYLIPDSLQSHSELYTECQWSYRPGDRYTHDCILSEKDQGLRLKPGPNPSQEIEKKPLEFLECVGYKVTLRDCGVVKESWAEIISDWILDDMGYDTLQQPASGSSKTSTLDGLKNEAAQHGPGRVVCSDCAYHNYVDQNRCIWSHDRMRPLCRECSTNPCMEVYDVSPGLDVPNLFHNIRIFAQGGACHECDCYERFAPANGFHLCARCQTILNLALRYLSSLARNALYKRTGTDSVCFDHCPITIPNHDHFRNFCPCGKSWTELVQSWEGFSVPDRDKKLYRLCLMCLGHIPRKKVNAAKPTNCL